MPRPKYVRFDKIAPAHLRSLELFLQHGITGVRMNNHGQIAWIKHTLFGWVSPQAFLLIQRVENLPWDKVAEGGYRLNQALYNDAAVGPAVLLTAAAALVAAYALGDWTSFVIIAAGLLLPFGMILLTYLFFDGAKDVIEGALDHIKDRFDASVLAGVVGVFNPGIGDFLAGLPAGTLPL